MRIRPLSEDDTAQVLQINARNRPAVAALDAVELARLRSMGDRHRVAVDDEGQVAGYLLAFSDDAPYDGEEFRNLKQRLEAPFLYIDQVAIAPENRRQNIGRDLYDCIGEFRRCCCEVNLEPPNSGSLAFHAAIGFRQLDTLAVSDGRLVALLVKTN